METAKLTVKLPKPELEFIKQYAKEHGLTVTSIIDRYFSLIQSRSVGRIHPEVEKISGLVAPEVDARVQYGEYMAEKHK